MLLYFSQKLSWTHKTRYFFGEGIDNTLHIIIARRGYPILAHYRASNFGLKNLDLFFKPTWFQRSSSNFRCDRDASVFFTEIELTLIKLAIFLAKVLIIPSILYIYYIISYNRVVNFTFSIFFQNRRGSWGRTEVLKIKVENFWHAD